METQPICPETPATPAMKQFYMYVIHNLRSDQLAFSLYKKIIPKVAKTSFY